MLRRGVVPHLRGHHRGAAYCCGNNGDRALGTGEEQSSLAKAPVSGDLAFVASRGRHRVRGPDRGIGCDGTGYCRGFNQNGQLGVGTFDNRYVPTPISGGLTFAVP
jgi:hypothetical protein